MQVNIRYIEHLGQYCLFMYGIYYIYICTYVQYPKNPAVQVQIPTLEGPMNSIHLYNCCYALYIANVMMNQCMGKVSKQLNNVKEQNRTIFSLLWNDALCAIGRFCFPAALMQMAKWMQIGDSKTSQRHSSSPKPHKPSHPLDSNCPRHSPFILSQLVCLGVLKGMTSDNVKCYKLSTIVGSCNPSDNMSQIGSFPQGSGVQLINN